MGPSEGSTKVGPTHEGAEKVRVWNRTGTGGGDWWWSWWIDTQILVACL